MLTFADLQAPDDHEAPLLRGILGFYAHTRYQVRYRVRVQGMPLPEAFTEVFLMSLDNLGRIPVTMSVLYRYLEQVARMAVEHERDGNAYNLHGDEFDPGEEAWDEWASQGTPEEAPPWALADDWWKG